MILEEITKNIFHLNFPDQKDLASTFLRFQEFYESPEFKGKIFTLEEYKKWYISNSKKGQKTGEFTYYEDWSGFNIPSDILSPFYESKFNPLSEKEEWLLNLFKSKKNEKFYVLGTFGEEKKSLTHEIAHGLFHVNSEYSTKINNLLDKMPSEEKTNIHKILSESGGYHEDVWNDETQAYLISGLEKLKKYGLDISQDLIEIRKEFISVFEKYSKN